MTRKPPRSLVRLIDQVRAGVPLLVVAGIAAYTWWLVQSVPGLGGQAGATVAPTAPDYVLGQATVERFNAQGQRLSVMQGDTMTHYLDGDQLVVQGLRLVTQDPQGQSLNAVAREGRYQGLESTLVLTGGVRVTAQAPQGQGPMTFEGEALTVNTATRQLSSSRPVLLTTPQGTVRGNSLSYDARQGYTTVGGRVNGRLNSTRTAAPSAAAGSAP